MTMLQVPTRVQLDAKRSETVANQVKAALEDPGVAEFMALVTKIAEGSTMETVAAASMMMLQRKLFPANDSDSAEFAKVDTRAKSPRSDRPERGDRPDRGGERPERSDRPRGPRPGTTALTLSLGTRAGVRPQDLVGAIANEADLPSKEISGIRIDEFTSRVEVPNEAVERVTNALHATKIRGRKVKVELERAGSSPESKPAERASAPRAPRVSTPRAPRASASRAPRASASRAQTPEFVEAPVATEPVREEKPRFGDRPAYAEKKSFGDKPRFGDKKSFGDKPRFGDKPSFGEKKSFGDKPRFGDKPSYGEKKSFGDKPSFGEKKPFEKKSFGDKPRFGGESDKPSRFGSGARPQRAGRMEPKRR
jgi:23S rRNA pseudouridine2605 synthase